MYMRKLFCSHLIVSDGDRALMSDKTSLMQNVPDVFVFFETAILAVIVLVGRTDEAFLLEIANVCGLALDATSEECMN